MQACAAEERESPSHPAHLFVPSSCSARRGGAHGWNWPMEPVVTRSSVQKWDAGACDERISHPPEMEDWIERRYFERLRLALSSRVSPFPEASRANTCTNKPSLLPWHPQRDARSWPFHEPSCELRGQDVGEEGRRLARTEPARNFTAISSPGP